MAGGAFFGFRLVKQYLFPIHGPDLLVASGANHIAVFTLQWECGSLIVIEERWFPLSRIVAVGAGRDLVRFRKLLSVRIFVAFLALARRSLEIYVD